jgi:hypothetical protein
MGKEFATYNLSLKLKELGFNEPCLAYFDCERNFQFSPNKIKFLSCEISTPTLSQCFKWFRDKHELYYVVEGSIKYAFQYFVYTHEYEIKSEESFKTYEEAEIACLNKLIELIEPKVELTYEERIKWFIQNYYESGMEYELLLISMKNENLDAFKWYDEIISIPKFKNNLHN